MSYGTGCRGLFSLDFVVFSPDGGAATGAKGTQTAGARKHDLCTARYVVSRTPLFGKRNTYTPDAACDNILDFPVVHSSDPGARTTDNDGII